MTRHAYLPTLILSDKGSQFRSEVVAEITQILEIQISHASTKHAQTIGILERTHASIKTALKISTGERRSIWHKYVQTAVMNYNTTYHETLGCEPSTVFHGRIPYNVLDLKLGIKPKWKTTPNSDIAEQLQKQIDEVRATAKDNIMLSYLKYKKYYDRKASAAPLKVNDYCYILNPKADNQSTKFAFQDCIWTGPYIVIKILSNNNYTIRRLGTRYKHYIGSEYVLTCQNNDCLTSQYEQMTTFLIRTSKCHTMSGTRYRGKWISENRLMNTKHQKVQKTIDTQKYEK